MSSTSSKHYDKNKLSNKHYNDVEKNNNGLQKNNPG